MVKNIIKSEKKNHIEYLEGKHVKMAIAVIIAVVAAFLVFNTYGIRYETNDDATLSNIAAGAYGDTIHMIYVNVLFSILLRPLYALIQINWYVVVQVILVVISIAVIIYLLLNKLGLLAGSMISLSILVAFSGEIFYTFHYTECSFIIMSAGLLLIVDNLENFNKNVIIGIILTLIGSMLRWNSFYAVGGLSAALLLYKFFYLDREGKKKAIFTMVTLFSVVFGSKIIDVMAYKLDPAWNEFTKYNAVRTAYSDFKVLYLTEENPFADYGISDVDYTMLNNWDFYDEVKFNIPLLEKISDGHQEITFFQLIINTLKQIKRMLTGRTYNYMFFLIAIFSILRLRPRFSTLPLIGMYGVFGVLMLYLTYEIRFPSWVQLGLIWTVISFALYCIAEMKINRKLLNVVSILTLILIIYLSEPFYTNLHTGVEDYNTWTKFEQQYFDEMNRDKENLYLLSTTSINVAAGFDVMKPHTENYYSNIVAYGGWLSRAPHRNEALNKYGLIRPLVDAVDNPNVYLDYHNISIAEQYVEQELGCEIYVVTTGKNAYAPYQLTTIKPDENV